jgi:hypothetical protein
LSGALASDERTGNVYNGEIRLIVLGVCR